MTNSVNRARQSRARLALLAEKAFGLESVRLPRRRAAAPAAPPTSKPPRPAALPATRPAPAAVTTPPRPPPGPPPVPPAGAARTPDISLLGGPVTRPTIFAPAPIVGDPMPTKRKSLALQQLDESQVQGCLRCKLSAYRTKTVFGEGDVDALIMFIGEGPGENEDLTGRPFVGRAGELLDRMIAGMGLKREQVYIANLVKCRPPGNRAPAPDEVAACTPYLETQIETVRPRVIVTLGAPAAKYVLRDDKVAITRMRGQWREYRGIKVMPTFHPAYILRQYTPAVRGQVWSDLQAVMAEVGLPVPQRNLPPG